MQLRDTARLALEAVTRNTLRTSLTVLGIVIGIAAVIAMVTIGRGATAKVEADIARLGTRILTLATGQNTRGGGGARIDAKPFDYRDVEALRDQVRGLQHVVPAASRRLRVVAARHNVTATIVGTEAAYFTARDWRIVQGRNFSGYEVLVGKPVCVIGEAARASLFRDQDAVGQLVRVSGVGCTVIGVLAPRGQSGTTGEDDDNLVAIPFDAFQRRIQGTPDIRAILMTVQQPALMARTKTAIAALMRERRGLTAGEREDFTLLDMRELAATMSATNRTMTTLLGWIAAISLLVGGIGIMNIMLVSVTERTREIGIRLAIGALPAQVRAQFLGEALILAAAGGVVGTATGLAVSWAAVTLLALPFLPDLGLVALALGAALMVGLASGIVPAMRASKLDPMIALRHL